MEEITTSRWKTLCYFREKSKERERAREKEREREKEVWEKCENKIVD